MKITKWVLLKNSSYRLSSHWAKPFYIHMLNFKENKGESEYDLFPGFKWL